MIDIRTPCEAASYQDPPHENQPEVLENKLTPTNVPTAVPVVQMRVRRVALARLVGRNNWSSVFQFICYRQLLTSWHVDFCL